MCLYGGKAIEGEVAVKNGQEQAHLTCWIAELRLHAEDLLETLSAKEKPYVPRVRSRVCHV
jgi:hypothetical protein